MSLPTSARILVLLLAASGSGSDSGGQKGSDGTVEWTPMAMDGLSLQRQGSDALLTGDHFAIRFPLFPADVLDAWIAYDWPGNVRRLRKVIERLDRLATDRVVTREMIGLEAGRTRSGSLSPFKEAKQQLVDAWERDYLLGLIQQAHGNLSAAARIAGIARAHLHRLLAKHELNTD